MAGEKTRTNPGLSGKIERIVDYLPDPFLLFIFLALLTVILSYIFSMAGVTAIHPASGRAITVVNLLSIDGLQRMFTNALGNFINFPPLGIVLAAMLGIGLAEKSGFLTAGLKQMVLIVPQYLVLPALVFAAVNSSILADAGIVILPPMGAILFKSMGRHPIAGLAAAFTGVVGGFSANIMLTALDPMLAAFSQSAANLLDKSYVLYPTANYYFMTASAFFVTAVITFVTVKYVEPRLQSLRYNSKDDADESFDNSLTKKEKSGLLSGTILFTTILAVVFVLIAVEGSFFHDAQSTLLPFYKSIIPLIIIIFGFSGIVYGKRAGTIRNTGDVASMLGSSMAMMGPYIVLAFFAGQFIAYFDWSNLGLVTAIKGSDFLKSIGLNGIPLLMAFLLFCVLINLFIASASAKWAILSSVFVPMMMLMGYSPETTQVVYRVGDSVTNMVTPLLPYFPIVLAMAKKYSPDITLGKLISTLVPYSIFLIIGWGLFLAAWLLLDIPLGPDVSQYYQLIH